MISLGPERLLQAILDNSPNVIFVKDSDGCYILANKGYEKLMGVEVPIVGKTDYDLFSKEDAEKFQKADREAISRGISSVFEETFTLNGKKFLFLTSKFPFLDEQGNPYAVCGIAADITDLRAAQNSAWAISEINRAVFENAKYAFITFSREEGVVTSFNRAAEEIFGYSVSEVVNRFRPSQLFFSHEIEKLRIRYANEVAADDDLEFLSQLNKLGSVEAHQWTFAKKDGSRFDGYCSFCDLKDREGNQSGYLAIIYDNSKDQEMKAELIRAKEAAEAGTKVKNEFLANISHELRTPMNTIMGMAEILLETGLSAEQERYLRVLSSASDSMLKLIDDILNLSQIEAGLIRLEKIPYSLRDLISQVMEMFEHKISAKGLSTQIDVSEDVPALLLGDPYRLRQVLVNLVGNAVKFTEKGHVGVRAQKVMHEKRTLLEIRVEDTGSGIPREKVPLLFQRFQQVDGSFTRKYGGLGLGLNISRKIVLLMGGEITVDSKVDEGSAFTVNLPLSEVST